MKRKRNDFLPEGKASKNISRCYIGSHLWNELKNRLVPIEENNERPEILKT